MLSISVALLLRDLLAPASLMTSFIVNFGIVVVFNHTLKVSIDVLLKVALLFIDTLPCWFKFEIIEVLALYAY